MYDSQVARQPNAFLHSDPVGGQGSVRFRVMREHLYSDLHDEAVILNLQNGKYYGLNAVGISVWNLIQEARSFTEIEALMLAEYEVEPTICRTEVSEFLRTMVQEGLVEVLDETA